MANTPRQPKITDPDSKALWLAVRRALLGIVAAIEQACGKE